MNILEEVIVKFNLLLIAAFICCYILGYFLLAPSVFKTVGIILVFLFGFIFTIKNTRR